MSALCVCLALTLVHTVYSGESLTTFLQIWFYPWGWGVWDTALDDKRFKIKDGKSFISCLHCPFFLSLSLFWKLLRHLVAVEQKFHMKGEQKAFSFIVKICYAMSKSYKIIRPMPLLLLVPLTKNLIFSNFTATIDSRDFLVPFNKVLTLHMLVQLFLLVLVRFLHISLFPSIWTRVLQDCWDYFLFSPFNSLLLSFSSWSGIYS